MSTQKPFEFSNKRRLSTTTMKRASADDKGKQSKTTPKHITLTDEVTVLGVGNENDLQFGIPRAWNENEVNRGSRRTSKVLAEIPGVPLIPSGRKSLNQGVQVAAGRKSLTQGQSQQNASTERKSLINFHEEEILNSLKVLENTSRVFIRKSKTNAKEIDLMDENGNCIYKLIDFSQPDLSIYEINYALMTSDGKKQILLMQGDSGLLNGEIVVRYPGSLPGDQELIYGSISQTTPTCSLSTKYFIIDSEKEPIFELKDRNKHCILSPFRKCSQSFYDIVTNGLPIIVGRIEERNLLIHTGPTNTNRKSIAITNKKKSLAKPLGSRRPTLTKNTSHTNFCIGFMNKLDYQTRGLVIAAHLLVNYDYLGRKKITKFGVGVALLVIFMLVLVGSGAAIALLII